MLNCILTIGRFQGFTKKHKELLELAKFHSMYSFDQDIQIPRASIVGIINGIKSSKEDPVSNPFSFGDRMLMIRKAFPDIICVKLNTGFIGEMLEVCYGINYNLVELVVGTDRYYSYKDQVDKPKYFEPFCFTVIKITPVYRGDDVSATQLRKALIENDRETFNEICAPEIQSMFDELRDKYKKRLDDCGVEVDYDFDYDLDRSMWKNWDFNLKKEKK